MFLSKLTNLNLRLLKLHRIAIRSVSFNNGSDDAELKEPGPEDCCQSGCAYCVWDVYAQKLRERNNHGVLNSKEEQAMTARVLTPFEALELRLLNSKKESTK